MAPYVPVEQEHIQSSVQVLLAFLSDENVSIPGSMLEGIFSGKSLLRGIISGSLVVCQRRESPHRLDTVQKVKKDTGEPVTLTLEDDTTEPGQDTPDAVQPTA